MSTERTVIINKTVRAAPRELGVEIENEKEELLNIKSDIIVKGRNMTNILDIARPYDAYISETYEPS